MGYQQPVGQNDVEQRYKGKCRQTEQTRSVHSYEETAKTDERSDRGKDERRVKPRRDIRNLICYLQYREVGWTVVIERPV